MSIRPFFPRFFYIIWTPYDLNAERKLFLHLFYDDQIIFRFAVCLPRIVKLLNLQFDHFYIILFQLSYTPGR